MPTAYQIWTAHPARSPWRSAITFVHLKNTWVSSVLRACDPTFQGTGPFELKFDTSPDAVTARVDGWYVTLESRVTSALAGHATSLAKPGFSRKCSVVYPARGALPASHRGGKAWGVIHERSATSP